MAVNNDENKDMTIGDFDKMIHEFIEWLENTDHKSFAHIASYDDDSHAYKWDVTIRFERVDD